MAHWCEECGQEECSFCYDFNGTDAEVEAHERVCPERPEQESVAP
jgi:hypothetical protein